MRGCVVLRPYGFGLWERLQAALDARFKETGHENAYFPLLIPESLLTREAEHVEGFAPEVAWVTQGGSETLTERLAIRPTSEVIIGVMYAEWIQSLPRPADPDQPVGQRHALGKATRPFLRTLEFLWQEGHTAHATERRGRRRGRAHARRLPRRSPRTWRRCPSTRARRARANASRARTHTYSIEALMPDGKALQAATSHELGQNFSKAYDITFAAEDQTVQHAWTTSWGMSWRMLGALIMVHGDDRGLRLPPKMAPHRSRDRADRAGEQRRRRGRRARALRASQGGGLAREARRAAICGPGYKFADWEMRGVPVRVEFGAKDLEAGRRDPRPARQREGRGGRQAGGAAGRPARPDSRAARRDPGESATLQARAFLESRTLRPGTAAEFFRLCRERAGMIDIAWCARPECEAAVKAETSATTRNTRPLEPGDTACVACGEPATVRAYFAQSY